MLTSSNFMRQQAMQSKMLYGRPIPVGRAVQGIADRAQNNTQQYGRRPYGVGFLVIGRDVSPDIIALCFATSTDVGSS